ncbi:MAG: TetR family transcriptional regulator [Victivallaceae bacterium]|nr:TetR family transcriptional regulator [Victivallaceae bacterium]
MKTYANTELTRKALIMAAGELFSEHGINAVTVRQIAKKAKENFGVIHYHFGGKDGLIEAVMDFATELWKPNPIGRFLEEHRYFLNKPNGQNTVIARMVEMFMEIVFSPEKPSWCCTFMFQLSQRDLEISRKAFDATAGFGLKAFIDFYYTVSGDNDFERAYNWSTAIVAPLALYALNKNGFKRLRPEGGEPSDKFLSKLKASCIHCALSATQFLRKRKEIFRRKSMNFN